MRVTEDLANEVEEENSGHDHSDEDINGFKFFDSDEEEKKKQCCGLITNAEINRLSMAALGLAKRVETQCDNILKESKQLQMLSRESQENIINQGSTKATYCDSDGEGPCKTCPGVIKIINKPAVNKKRISNHMQSLMDRLKKMKQKKAEGPLELAGPGSNSKASDVFDFETEQDKIDDEPEDEETPVEDSEHNEPVVTDEQGGEEQQNQAAEENTQAEDKPEEEQAPAVVLTPAESRLDRFRRLMAARQAARNANKN